MNSQYTENGGEYRCSLPDGRYILIGVKQTDLDAGMDSWGRRPIYNLPGIFIRARLPKRLDDGDEIFRVKRVSVREAVEQFPEHRDWILASARKVVANARRAQPSPEAERIGLHVDVFAAQIVEAQGGPTLNL